MAELFKIEYPKWFKIFYVSAGFGYLFILIIFFYYFLKIGFTLKRTFIFSFLSLFFLCGIFIVQLCLQYVSVTDKGIKSINFLKKKQFISWNEIETISKFPLRIPTAAVRKIKSTDGKIIFIEKGMRNYYRFIALVKEKNLKLKEFAE